MKAMNTYIAMGLVGLLAGISEAKTSVEGLLNDLHESNIHEINMGKMAQQKGYSTEMRDYGKTLVDDHQKADEKVTRVASQEGVTLKQPNDGLMDKMHKTELHHDSGADFDKDFSEMMVKDHKMDIDKLNKAQADGLPQDARDLVADLQPTLQKHLEIAQKIRANHK
jgi:putative membrane protein